MSSNNTSLRVSRVHSWSPWCDIKQTKRSRRRKREADCDGQASRQFLLWSLEAAGSRDVHNVLMCSSTICADGMVARTDARCTWLLFYFIFLKFLPAAFVNISWTIKNSRIFITMICVFNLTPTTATKCVVQMSKTFHKLAPGMKTLANLWLTAPRALPKPLSRAEAALVWSLAWVEVRSKAIKCLISQQIETNCVLSAV